MFSNLFSLKERKVSKFSRSKVLKSSIFLILAMLISSLAFADATITVTTLLTTVDGDTNSISALMIDPGADETISFDEALAAAKNSLGVNTIEFAVTGTISMTGGYGLGSATDSGLSIIGPDENDPSAITFDGTDAGENSHCFQSSSFDSNIEIRNIKIINCPRAVFSLIGEDLTLDNIYMADNGREPMIDFWMNEVTNTNITISNCLFENAAAGVLWAQLINNSTFSNNTITNPVESGFECKYCSNNTITNNTIISPGQWGILLIDDSDENSISGNSVINAGADGIAINSNSTDTICQNNTVSLNTVANATLTGITVNASNTNITNNIVYGSGNGGIVIPNANASNNDLSFNEIYNCVGAGVSVQNQLSDLENNTIYNNSSDGVSIDHDGTSIVRNNIIVGNSGFGISVSSGTVTSNFNNVYDNTSGSYNEISEGESDVSVDPFFVDAANGDFNLKGFSRCIDAGSTDGSNPDNETDIGAQVYGERSPSINVPDDFALIQDAIDYAATGDTILVAEKEDAYEETLEMKSDITLSCASELGDCILQGGDEDNPAVDFNNISNAVIDKFVIQSEEGVGIEFWNGSYANIIRDSIVKDTFEFNIECETAGTNILKNVDFDYLENPEKTYIEEGTLNVSYKIRVKVQEDDDPISNAKVEIFYLSESPVFSGFTNSDGFTTYTNNLAGYSLTPEGQTDVREYSLSVSHSDYENYYLSPILAEEQNSQITVSLVAATLVENNDDNDTEPSTITLLTGNNEPDLNIDGKVFGEGEDEIGKGDFISGGGCVLNSNKQNFNYIFILLLFTLLQINRFRKVKPKKF